MSGDKKLNVEEVADTNYTYTVYIDGTKEGTYGSKEEAKAVVNRKKEQAPREIHQFSSSPLLQWSRRFCR